MNLRFEEYLKVLPSVTLDGRRYRLCHGAETVEDERDVVPAVAEDGSPVCGAWFPIVMLTVRRQVDGTLRADPIAPYYQVNSTTQKDNEACCFNVTTGEIECIQLSHTGAGIDPHVNEGREGT